MSQKARERRGWRYESGIHTNKPIVKVKRTKGKTMIYKTLCRKL
jgi:hypothetical protein